VRLILQGVSQTITQSRAEFESKKARKVEDAPAAPAGEAAAPVAAPAAA